MFSAAVIVVVVVVVVVVVSSSPFPLSVFASRVHLGQCNESWPPVFIRKTLADVVCTISSCCRNGTSNSSWRS